MFDWYFYSYELLRLKICCYILFVCTIWLYVYMTLCLFYWMHLRMCDCMILLLILCGTVWLFSYKTVWHTSLMCMLLYSCKTKLHIRMCDCMIYFYDSVFDLMNWFVYDWTTIRLYVYVFSNVRLYDSTRMTYLRLNYCNRVLLFLYLTLCLCDSMLVILNAYANVWLYDFTCMTLLDSLTL